MEVPVVHSVLQERIKMKLNKHLVLVALWGHIIIKQDQYQKLIVQIVPLAITITKRSNLFALLVKQVITNQIQVKQSVMNVNLVITHLVQEVPNVQVVL